MSHRSPTVCRRRRTPLAWLLVVLILLQPVVTYLATPWFAQDDEGHYLTLCTLEGEKRVYVGDLLGDADTAPEHCPALKLLQLAESARAPAPLETPLRALYAVALLEQTADRPRHRLHFSAYAPRAPPRV
jgi:hypothetical protein